MATTAKKTAGRPSSNTPKTAPKAAPVSTVSSSATKVKRQLVDDSKKDKVYTITKGGGIWYKLKQNNITVFDEESQQVRQLRYSPNEMSVWADEQGENIIREQIAFIQKKQRFWS